MPRLAAQLLDNDADPHQPADDAKGHLPSGEMQPSYRTCTCSQPRILLQTMLTWEVCSHVASAARLARVGLAA